MMDYLPLNIEIKQQRVLIVGGGNIALRKARLLSRSGAILVVVAPKIHAELKKLVTSTAGVVVERQYQTQDLHDVCLVVAATDDMAVNQQVSKDANVRD